MRRRLQIDAMPPKRKRSSSLPLDSAVGSSPHSRQRTMALVPAAAALPALASYGPRAVAAITAAQRIYRANRRARTLYGYARGLKRVYDRFGSRAAHAMNLFKRPPTTKGKRGALPNQYNDRYRLTRMSGTIGGKFKRPRKLSKKVNKYETKGFQNTTEVTGTVSDPDCVYIGASSISMTHAIELAACALLRQLFEKCVGIPVTDINTPLQGYYNSAYPFNNADGFRLQLTWMQVNNATGEREITYETSTTDSIKSIVGEAQLGVAGTWTGLMPKLIAWAARSNTASDVNSEVPLRLNLYRRDGNVTNFYMGSGGLDLRNTKIHYQSTCNVKLQNRSVSATGSASTDVVDANPLQGYLYQYKGGVPMFKNLDQATGTLRINRMFDDGAVLVARAGSFGTRGNIYKEPPTPRFFNNCVKSSKIKLAPGDVKTHFFSWTVTCNFLEFLHKIGCQVTADSGRQTISSPGKCILFALEEMLNVSSTHLIAVSYEINRVDKCYSTSSPYKVASGSFSQIIRNELAP